MVEALIGIAVCLLLIAEIKIITGMCRRPLEKRPEEDTRSGTRWIIVLGAQVRGRKITDSLKRRLDSALEYLKEHPDVHVIVSGGQGNDEEVTEGVCNGAVSGACRDRLQTHYTGRRIGKYTGESEIFQKS